MAEDDGRYDAPPGAQVHLRKPGGRVRAVETLSLPLRRDGCDRMATQAPGEKQAYGKFLSNREKLVPTEGACACSYHPGVVGRYFSVTYRFIRGNLRCGIQGGIENRVIYGNSKGDVLLMGGS